MRADRAGYTLVEALVALLVAGVLTLCLALLLGVIGRAALRHAETSAAAETERTVGAVLGAELRFLTAADAAFADDSVRLRAFRGRGIVCAVRGNEIAVSYHGVRSPEEDKDSVLVVWGDREVAYDVDGVYLGGGCPDESYRITVARTALAQDTPLVALLFETGAYSISAGALRYRRGSAGRQPITEENLAAGGGIARAQGGAAASVSMRPLRANRSQQTRWLLGMPQGASRP